MTAPFRFDADATATPGYRPRPQPTMRAAGPRPAGSNRPSTVMDQFLDAIASAFQPGEDTAGGMLKEMVSPIRAGVQFRESAQEASRAAGQGRVGAALGSAALAAMAVPGVPGDEGVRAAKVADNAADVARPGIRAYHGTPHTFAPEPDAPLGRFRMDKIGTGEGAAAFGHGINLAEAQPVAELYRKSLTFPESTFRLVDDVLDGHDYFGTDSRMGALGVLEATPDWRTKFNVDPDNAAILDLWMRHKPTTGATLEVGVDAAPDQLLDWDAPLTKQSPAIRRALRELAQDESFRPMIREARRDGMTGGEFYEMVAGDADGGEFASEALGGVGIPGVRYLDGNSRVAGQGTRNYVIWDESKLRILRALAAAGMVSGAALAKAEQEFAAQSPEGN